jgi:protein required for attachment to host cells
MKPTVTWIVIADGQEARFYANHGPNKGLEKLSPNDISIDLERTSEIVTDDRGRAFDSAGQGRHGMEPQSDPHDEQKRRFLKGVAKGLNAAAKAGQFDQLVIAAPPKALGELRQDLDDKVKRAIRGELHKDLVNTPDDELAKHFEDVLPI